MARSARHKSSKHSSKEARDYSDSEKESSFKEKKARDDSGSGSTRHLKESVSGEKRKLELKSVDIARESVGQSSVEYVDSYDASSLKKRKDKVDDDRWTGGYIDEHELLRSEIEMRGSTHSKIEEVKRGGSKSEPKYHRSERKERSEKGGSERDRKATKDERLVDGILRTNNPSSEGNRKQEERGEKYAVGNTDDNLQDGFRKLEQASEHDRQSRRKSDGSGDGQKNEDGVGELDDRRLSSKNEIAKSGKFKTDGHKDDKTRDKYQEDVDKDRHQYEKHRDTRPSRDYTSSRDRERERDRGRDRDYDHGHRDHDRDGRDHDLDRDRGRDLDRGHDRDRELDRDRESGRDRDHYRRERDRDRIRDRDRNHDRRRDRDYDHGHDYSHLDDKGCRYKEEGGRRKSPDGYDDYPIDKPRRLESEADKERSQSRKGLIDGLTSSSRCRTSPSSRSYVSTDKYRDGTQGEFKYGDSLRDVTVMSETLDRVPNYRSGEKRSKYDSNHIGELLERSPSTKPSPVRLKEISPTSVDRRYVSRSGKRRSIDVEEAERRSSGSNDIRDVSVNEDRQSREFSAKKPYGEECPQVESLFYHKSSQGNVHVPGPPGFRAGADSPSLIGSLGEDSRGHSGSRYRRSVDPNMGRGAGIPWKGVPNWPSPLPNGFMPFPPGPPRPNQGGFRPMLSQFPPLFGVRPSLEMSRPGIPYHMADADRFPGHVRPLRWQNMVDGSVPRPRFHGWDANNGAPRDEPSMFGAWHLGARGRDMNGDMWKSKDDVNREATSGSQKDGHMVEGSTDEASPFHGAPRPHHDSSYLDDQGMSIKMNNTSSVPSSSKEILPTPSKVTTEKTPESSIVDDIEHTLRACLTNLDISMNLADQELCNQCISLAVKEQTEHVEEDIELEYVEEKAAVRSEVTNLTMDVIFLPPAKDSIFQRAMDLYKTHSTETRTSATSNGQKMSNSPLARQVLVSEERVDGGADCSVEQEEPTLAVAEDVAPTTTKEEVPITGNKVLNDVTSPQAADLVLALEDVGVEKKEEKCSTENMEKGRSTVKETQPDAIDASANVGGVDNDGMAGVVESASDEQSDVAVSHPLILSHDSVKVSEALMSVSNESESVILSRIHHAPESTH